MVGRALLGMKKMLPVMEDSGIEKFDSVHRDKVVFFFNDTATTEIYSLSLHDALPIYLSSAQQA